MKQYLAILIGSLLAGLAYSDELILEKNRELSFVLANFELLSEVKYPESSNHIAVFKVQDHGECDGSPKTCPQSTIYITASEYGEFPEQKVYVLPKKHEWEFIEWVKLTEYEGSENFIELKMKAKLPNKDFSKSWWVEEYYLIKVNYHHGKWEKL